MKMSPYFALVAGLVLFLFAVNVVFGSEPYRPRIDREKMLWAIREIEGWKPGKVGAAGEMGPYQMMPALIKHYSPRLALSEHEIALLHLDRVCVDLHKLHYVETPWNVALLWTCGLPRFMDAPVPAAKLDYATRCANLYADRR